MLPSLINPKTFESILKINKKVIQENAINTFTTQISNKFINFIDYNKGIIILILGIVIFLFILYKFKNNKINNEINIEFNRNQDIKNKKVIKTVDEIKNKENYSNELLDLVRSKIEYFDNNINKM